MEGREAPHGGVGRLRVSPADKGSCSPAFWAFGLCGEIESREWFGLFGEIHPGLSTENLGLFRDRCWTLSVNPPMFDPSATNMLS
jgi:hypothetical protein